MDAPVALAAARLQANNHTSEHDALIAATALMFDFALVTRNVRDFEAVVGLRLVNPWDA